MYCTKCGKEIKDESKFCIYCGEQVIVEKSESEEVAQITEATDNTNKPIEGLRVFGGIISIILWCVIFKMFLDIFQAKEEDFRGIYKMYNHYGSISPISNIIFYGVMFGVGIFAILGVIAAIKKSRKFDKWAMLGCITIIVALWIMKSYVDAMENHFLDTSNIYMKYLATAIYTENLKKSIYVYLGLNILIVKFKQMTGKY